LEIGGHQAAKVFGKLVEKEGWQIADLLAPPF
jgi:hypothetical protein